MPKELTPAVVKEWLSIAGDTFDVREAWNEIGIDSPQGRNHLRVILFRFEHQDPPLVANIGGGRYRKVQADKVKIEWEIADPTKTVLLKFPFGEEEFVRIYPKSIIIVAGGKNEGKTEYLYEFIKLNSDRFNIDLFNSETGAEQMKERFDIVGIKPSPSFNVYERFDNFADVIDPSHISVIDYLDMNSEVYLVGTEIDRIFRKLRSVAVIGLQKPPPTKMLYRGVEKLVERDLAYGGGFTAKRASLYISLGMNKLKLVYVKTPKQKKVIPQNMTFSFQFSETGQFTSIQRYYGDGL